MSATTPSYTHDAEVLVFNFQTRATESAELSASTLPLGGPPGGTPGPMDTTRVSLREAIISISCNKSKGEPQGSFAITLKPTQEWTEIIVPGSWCAIFMKDSSITDADLNAVAKVDPNEATNFISPLKMVGIVMSVRVNKQRDNTGAYTLTYTLTGYDFGYALLSSIYVNYSLQSDVAEGKLKAPFSELKIPNNQEVIGDPALNVQRVLQAWSVMSNNGVPGNLGAGIAAPPIRMKIPSDLASFMGTGTEVLSFISTAIGVDTRPDKTFTPADNGQVTEFDFKLAGVKFFQVWEVVSNNSLWGMINQYLNSILNEAYCDLHIVNNSNGSTSIRPALIVRQQPYSTPDYDTYWNFENATFAPPLQSPKYNRTMLVDVPATTIPDEKVLNYDIGYSDQERVNFIEVNAFTKDHARNNFGAFNDINRPKFEEGSITRAGLRKKIFMGADYGALWGNIQETGAWSPLLMDWWFNSNRYANGTVECIGLMQHIALGENFILRQENLLGHIVSYTHTLTVDKDSGHKTFRTNIDFIRGIKADSNQSQYNFIYGDAKFSSKAISQVLSSSTSSASIFEQDVSDRVSLTKTGKQTTGNPSSQLPNDLTKFLP